MSESSFGQSFTEQDYNDAETFLDPKGRIADLLDSYNESLEIVETTPETEVDPALLICRNQEYTAALDEMRASIIDATDAVAHFLASRRAVIEIKDVFESTLAEMGEFAIVRHFSTADLPTDFKPTTEE